MDRGRSADGGDSCDCTCAESCTNTRPKRAVYVDDNYSFWREFDNDIDNEQPVGFWFHNNVNDDDTVRLRLYHDHNLDDQHSVWIGRSRNIHGYQSIRLQHLVIARQLLR